MLVLFIAGNSLKFTKAGKLGVPVKEKDGLLSPIRKLPPEE